jgi:hypothetical protein
MEWRQAWDWHRVVRADGAAGEPDRGKTRHGNLGHDSPSEDSVSGFHELVPANPIVPSIIGAS